MPSGSELTELVVVHELKSGSTSRTIRRPACVAPSLPLPSLVQLHLSVHHHILPNPVFHLPNRSRSKDCHDYLPTAAIPCRASADQQPVILLNEQVSTISKRFLHTNRLLLTGRSVNAHSRYRDRESCLRFPIRGSVV
jgi:hypothetical protein